MPRSRNSRSASPQKPVSAESSEIERRKTYQNVHDIFCEAVGGDVIKLVLQECNWKGEESIEKLLVIAESQDEQKRYKSKLHRIAEGIFGSLRSEDYSNAGATSTLSQSEKVIRRPTKTSTIKNVDQSTDNLVQRGPHHQVYQPQSVSSEKVAGVDEIEMDLNFPHLPTKVSENNLSSTSSSVNSQRSFIEVSKKPLSSKTALLSQAQSAFSQQFDDAEGTQRWEECKDKLSEHYLTNLKEIDDGSQKKCPSASAFSDDPAILQAGLARPRSEPMLARQDIEKQRSESGRSFPVRLLSRSPDSVEDMKTLNTSGHGVVKRGSADDFMKSTGDLDETVLKCINEINGDLLDDTELERSSKTRTESVGVFSAADPRSGSITDGKSVTKSSNEPMTLPTIGLSVNAAEFVPRPKPVVTTLSTEIVNVPSPEPTSRTKRSNSVEIKAGVRKAGISSPTIPIGSPLTISPALSPGLSPQSTQMNSPVANLTGSPMFITPKWPQVHSGMAPLQHVVLASPQRYVHPTPAHHMSSPAYRFQPAVSVPYSTRMVYSVAPPPLIRASGMPPYVQQPNIQNIEDRAAVATGQPIMATSESSQLGQPTAALNAVKLMSQSSMEQKVEKVRIQQQSGVKVLIILRGLPGSGKSTLARALQLSGIVLSTDDYFMNGGRYDYKSEKLNEAHQWNKERAKEAMKMGKSPIVIDNTNTMIWEFKPYITLGVNNNYHVEIFEPDTPWKMKPSELARRTLHGVSLEHIKRMLQRYDHNVSMDTVLKKKSTPDLKTYTTTEEPELLSRLNTSLDEKSSSSQEDVLMPSIRTPENRIGKDVRFQNLLKSDEFRKQKSGESDSDSLSSYHSDTWSNQSSRNASPKPLRSSLKTPGILQKMEKLKPLGSVKPAAIKPTVRKVKRKAIKQIESKLSANTLKEVDEMVKEHVNGQVLSVEDVSKREEELKALLQFCAIDEAELASAEELIGLKLHDAIHQSFEVPGPNTEPEGSDSDSDSNNKSAEDIPKLIEPNCYGLVESTLSAVDDDIDLEYDTNEEKKVALLEGEPVIGNKEHDEDIDVTVEDKEKLSKDDDSSHKKAIPTWKDIAFLKKSNETSNSGNPHFLNDAVSDENCEITKLAVGSIGQMDQEFELRYWGGEIDINGRKLESNLEIVANSWDGEEWEESSKESENIIKPQRMKKSHGSELILNNDSTEGTDLCEDFGSIKKALPAIPKDKDGADDDIGGDDDDNEYKHDSDDSNNKNKDLTKTNNLAGSKDILISNNSDNNLANSRAIEIGIGNEVRHEENNTDLSSGSDLQSTKNSLSCSGSNYATGNNNESLIHDHPHSPVNSSLQLLKDSYTDTESAIKSSVNINHCDKHSLDEIARNNVQDISLKQKDEMVKNEFSELDVSVESKNEDSYVDSMDDDEGEIEHSSDKKVMKLLPESGKLETETPKVLIDKVGAVGTQKKKSTRRKQEEKKKRPFLNSEDTEKFKKANWSSFPLVSSESVAASSENKPVKGKNMNSVATMTSIKYFNIVVRLNQGGFIGDNIKYLTGNPKKLVNGELFNVDSDFKKVYEGRTEVCLLEKGTTTVDLVPMNDSEGVEFLQTCFPSAPDDELECVLEICSNNVEWAINLLLDWKYSMNLTEDEKKTFSDKMAEIQKDKNSDDVQMELTNGEKGPPTLLDMCFNFIEKENIANRADIESQLIKTGKDRLDTIEKDNMTKIKLQRSLSRGETSLDWTRESISDEMTNDVVMINYAETGVNLELFASDNKAQSKYEKVHNGEDVMNIDDFVSRKSVNASSSVHKVEDAAMTGDNTEASMTMDLKPDVIVQLEDMFGSLKRKDDVNSTLSVPIDCNTAWRLYQCVKTCLARSQVRDEEQLLRDEEFARKLQEEENSYSIEPSKASNGSRPKRAIPTIGYTVKGTIPSPSEPVSWTRGNQSLAEIMREQQKIQDRKSEFQKLIEKEGAHAVMSTRLKRQRLHETFPKVDRNQLDEIFQASCFNLTETIQAVSTSLGEGPVISPTPTTVLAQDPVVDGQKLVEAAKQKSIDDMVDLCSYHPGSGKDYQDGVEPEYEDYRGEANLHHKLRHECFQKAREAYRRGLKQVASFYSQQGHQHTQKVKEANMRASDQILADRNNDKEKNMTVDLHGLHTDEAREALNRIIPQKERERCKQLTVITGRGSHSRGGVAKLRPSVIDYLNKNKYNYTEVSIGVFKVSLKYRTPDR